MAEPKITHLERRKIEAGVLTPWSKCFTARSERNA
jgi:hypothetical protein